MAAGPTSERAAGLSSASELLRRVHARGGEMRVAGSVVQYRPHDALSATEREWLREHRGEVLRVLAPDPGDIVVFERWLRNAFGATCLRLGAAGPGCPVWVRTGPERRSDSGGSTHGLSTPRRQGAPLQSTSRRVPG